MYRTSIELSCAKGMDSCMEAIFSTSGIGVISYLVLDLKIGGAKNLLRTMIF